jgi:hypothetical protein
MDNQDPSPMASSTPSEEPSSTPTSQTNETSDSASVAVPVSEQPSVDNSAVNSTGSVSSAAPAVETTGMPTESEQPAQPVAVVPTSEPVVSEANSEMPVSQTTSEPTVNEPSSEPTTGDVQSAVPVDSNMSNTSVNDPTEEVMVPDKWPGVFAVFKQVKPSVKKVFWLVFLIYVVVGFAIDLLVRILTGSLSMTTTTGQTSLSSSLISTVVPLLASAFITGASLSLIFAALNKTVASLSSAMKTGISKLVIILLSSIIVGFISIVSFVLLVIPFFFVAPRLILAPYLIVGENAGIMDSVSRSWRITKGSLGKIYGIFGLQLLLVLLCLTIIGIPFAIYWGVVTLGVTAQLCRFLVANEGSPASQPVASSSQTPSDPVSPVATA